MKKLEMEYILLLIDKHTKKECGYYGTGEKMYDEDIQRLRCDIKAFYEGHKDEGEK